ncbi:MAG: hypothetical protein M1825_000609 [Sarcosagium campestre]|nr:MAG: hypothetical protein M1825_000609 [Sarcosagium campestre]
MPSLLTRHVFRRILSNQPYVHHPRPTRYCALIAASTLVTPRHGLCRGRQPQRRCLFGFPSKPPRYLKPPDLDPGLDKMEDLYTMIKLRCRPPPADELVKAFKAFFKARRQAKGPLQELQAERAAVTFRHLQEHNATKPGFGLSDEDLYNALEALTNIAHGSPAMYKDFATHLFEETCRRRKEAAGEDDAVGVQNLAPYVTILCQTSSPVEARTLLEKHCRADTSLPVRRLWTRVLRGMTEQRAEGELVKTLDMMKENGIPFDANVHEVMTVYHALDDNVDATKHWYAHPIDGNESPAYHTHTQVLKFCIRNHQLDWGDSVFKTSVDSVLDKKAWDVMLQWAAAWGKGVDEIERMMGIMVRANESDGSVRPDIDTINGLVGFANARNDAYAAERFVALGEKLNLKPNARTYILQMSYRLHVGDVDGARAAYHNLQSEEVEEGEDLPAINRLVRSLCSAKSPHAEAIGHIMADLESRGARLEPRTVSALCLHKLSVGDILDAHDLLQAHVFHFSEAERDALTDDLVRFIFDRSYKTSRAWDTYTLLREVFPNMPVATRTEIMLYFFSRRRPDMAVHTFGHMRQHLQPDIRPRLETYIACLDGIGRAGDLEGLEMVHNMLKLDVNIEPCTRLYNALMIAYTGCGFGWRAVEFWEDIANSAEGPTYNSIVIALKACFAKKPYGEREATGIWTRLRDLDVQVTSDIAASYLAVLGKNEKWDEARQVMDRMEQDTGLKLDALMLGEFFNAMYNYTLQDDAEVWVAERYPEAWAALEKLGCSHDQVGKKIYPVKIDVTA